MFKTVVGWSVSPGVSTAEFERWYFDVHVPLLLKVPGLRRVVTSKVVRSVESQPEFEIVAELYYDNQEAFEKSRKSPERQAVLGDPKRRPEYVVNPKRFWLSIVQDARTP